MGRHIPRAIICVKIVCFSHSAEVVISYAWTGQSFGRSAEAIKFFLALRRHGMPVILSDARGLAARITETDVIGIVPEGVLPVYCESWFPRNDILDFMNLPFENNSRRAKIIAKAQWYPLEQARLKDADD